MTHTPTHVRRAPTRREGRDTTHHTHIVARGLVDGLRSFWRRLLLTRESALTCSCTPPSKLSATVLYGSLARSSGVVMQHPIKRARVAVVEQHYWKAGSPACGKAKLGCELPKNVARMRDAHMRLEGASGMYVTRSLQTAVCGTARLPHHSLRVWRNLLVLPYTPAAAPYRAGACTLNAVCGAVFENFTGMVVFG